MITWARSAVGPVLALVVFVGMLTLPGGIARSALVLVALLAQGLLLVGDHRAGTVRGPSRFAFLWSLQAGLTHLAAGEDTAASAAVYIATGLLFAGPLTAYLAWAAHRPEPKDPTEPLPVVGDPDGP